MRDARHHHPQHCAFMRVLLQPAQICWPQLSFSREFQQRCRYTAAWVQLTPCMKLPSRRLPTRLSNVQERMDGIESKRRNRPVEESLAEWKEMVAGSPEGKRYCMRFKINMQVPPAACTGTAWTTAPHLVPLCSQASVALLCWGGALTAAC